MSGMSQPSKTRIAYEGGSRDNHSRVSFWIRCPNLSDDVEGKRHEDLSRNVHQSNVSEMENKRRLSSAFKSGGHCSVNMMFCVRNSKPLLFGL